MLFKNEQKAEPLTEEKRDYYHKEWDTLSKTDEVLCIWKDEELKTVPADYYDSLIIEKLEKPHQKQESKDFTLTGNVIGEIVAELQEFVNSFYIGISDSSIAV